MFNHPITSQSVENLIDSIDASIYWKDISGRYLAVNKKFIDISGLSSDRDILGSKDNDLLWQEQADKMMKNDGEVMHLNQKKSYFESALSSLENKVLSYLSHKFPLESNKSNKIIGVFGISLLVTSDHSADNKKYPLSKQQLNCLRYLVMGLTMKQISMTMNLSIKTVEHYFVAIKHKLNCKTRAELVVAALKMPIIKNYILSL